jgi:hypothetical protein
MYAEAQKAAGAGAQAKPEAPQHAEATADDNVVDADFKEVKK